MLSSQALKAIVTELRPVIERQLADAEVITAMREAVTAQGGDWSAIKALVKAQCQDALDDSGDGKRVRKIIEKSEFTTQYADMLGLNLNEENFIRGAAE